MVIGSDWIWQKPPVREGWLGADPDWWIGTDTNNCKWIVKMTGGFYAYREHVFASLAQRLGMSCQSSAYLIIPSADAEPRRSTRNSEPYQLAIWLMNEHGAEPCSADCPLKLLNQANFHKMHDADSKIPHIGDAARADVLGHLCGQFEPHGHFFTVDHEYVVIDNEGMFADPPSLRECRWIEQLEDRSMVAGVCRDLVDVSDTELQSIAAIPQDYVLLTGHEVFEDLRAAKDAASEYLDLFGNSL